MSKAIVIREHCFVTRGPLGPIECSFCALPQGTEKDCEPRLAAMPVGWDGETVEVDENTAAYLASKVTK